MNALDSALAHLLQAQERHTIDKLDQMHAKAAAERYAAMRPEQNVDPVAMRGDLLWQMRANAAYLASGLIVQAAAQEYNALMDERYLHAAK